MKWRQTPPASPNPGARAGVWRVVMRVKQQGRRRAQAAGTADSGLSLHETTHFLTNRSASPARSVPAVRSERLRPWMHALQGGRAGSRATTGRLLPTRTCALALVALASTNTHQNSLLSPLRSSSSSSPSSLRRLPLHGT